MDGNVLAIGTTLSWSVAFKESMEALCSVHGVAGPVPSRVGLSAVKGEGLLLVWPTGPDEPDTVPVIASAQARRVTTDLSDAFAKLGAFIPPGIASEIPFGPYHSPKYGQCLALHLAKATFLYKRSRGSAIGLLDNE